MDITAKSAIAELAKKNFTVDGLIQLVDTVSGAVT